MIELTPYIKWSTILNKVQIKYYLNNKSERFRNSEQYFHEINTILDILKGDY